MQRIGNNDSVRARSATVKIYSGDDHYRDLKAEAAGMMSREGRGSMNQLHVGLTTYDAKDPDTKSPPMWELRPPTGAPDVLVILIDEAGFGSSSAFGGPC